MRSIPEHESHRQESPQSQRCKEQDAGQAHRAEDDVRHRDLRVGGRRNDLDDEGVRNLHGSLIPVYCASRLVATDAIVFSEDWYFRTASASAAAMRWR